MPNRTIRLTKRTVDALVSNGKDTVIWDRDLKGFGVRMLASGRKVFVVQSRGPGGSRRASLGRHGKITVEQARARAVAAIGQIKRGEPPLAEPSGPVTVENLARRFLDDYVNMHCKARTREQYAGIVKSVILPALGDRTVESIGTADVAELHRGLHATPQRANHTLWIFSRMLSLAQTWEVVPPGRNPCRAVRPYKLKPRERFLNRDEFRRLGRALREAEADGSVKPGAIAAIRLLTLTGCRRTEILSLRWDDVDRTAGVLRLRDSKTGPRTVPLTAPALAVLGSIEPTPDSPFVFTGERTGRAVARIDGAWHRVRERAGLEDVRMHDLRHSYASRALSLGESLTAIGHLLGHRKVATTARYAHLVRDAEKAAAVRVGASIEAHLGGERREPEGQE
ncbi:MAG: tyrosine-type recombinase/integrase [Rhodospirillaceae bacterium]|nr:tyrosine-type recombinase/integrase [Rhodospirillaceae bacterium]